MPPCARILPSGECEAVCGNFERYLKDSQLDYIPENTDPELIKQEASEFAEQCFIKFVESGLCAYLIRLEQEKSGTTSQVVDASAYQFGQCVGLEGVAVAAKN